SPGSISKPPKLPLPSSAPSTASPSTAPAWPVSVNLRRRGAVGVDGGTDDAHLVAGGDDFKTAALQGAHFHHLVQEPVQQSDVDESYVRPGNKKHSRAFHVDAGSRGGRQSAMTQHYKFRAARITCAGVFENFFRLKVQKSQAHGAETENSFEVPTAAATAEVSLGLMEIWGILDHPASNNAGKTDTDGGDLFSASNFFDLLADAIHDALRGHGLQGVERLWFFRKDAERTENLVILHKAHSDVFHHEYANCPAHVAPAHSIESKIPAIDSSFGRD